MELKKILFAPVLLIILAFAGISSFVFAYSKGTEKTNQLQETPAPIIKPATQPVFDPASLNWEQLPSTIPWETRDSNAVVVYKDKLWLMGGLDANGHVISPGNVDYGNATHFSDVWNSEDGAVWQLVAKTSPWKNRRSIQVVDFKGKMWLMGGWGPETGYKNDVWSSEDGINWKLETASANWPAREGHQLVVFHDEIWLIGGVRYDKHQLFNDVWHSQDGINWTEIKNNILWSPRWDHSAGVFNNKLWVVGGMVFNSDKLLNDVWYSDDGANWSLANGNPPFATRQGNAIIDYQNKLWVVGRLNIPLYGGGSNDVWYSDDGENWKKTNNDPAWTGREDVSIIVFKNKIWVLGGMDKNWQWKNDVWFSNF